MIYNLIAKLLARPAIFKKILAYAKKTPYNNILSSDGTEVYMERYWVFNPTIGEKRKYQWIPLSIRLNKINKPDNDRHLHDHPFNARTFILKGAYIEERLHGRIRSRMYGSTATLMYGEYHKITSVTNGGVYTLFVTGKYQGMWGFLVDGIKVNFRDYFKTRK
jgi:hypothetical protein